MHLLHQHINTQSACRGQDLCKKYDIPTAQYEVFEDADQAKMYIRKQAAPLVVKADGLAAGKGVIVASTSEEACAAVDAMLVNKTFGSAGAPDRQLAAGPLCSHRHLLTASVIGICSSCCIITPTYSSIGWQPEDVIVCHALQNNVKVVLYSLWLQL